MKNKLCKARKAFNVVLPDGTFPRGILIAQLIRSRTFRIRRLNGGRLRMKNCLRFQCWRKQTRNKESFGSVISVYLGLNERNTNDWGDIFKKQAAPVETKVGTSQLSGL